jgi:DNA-binding NarL/FixJ family response regulator
MLSPYRGHHAVSGAGPLAYFGPVELWLGVGAAHLGLLDDAVVDLEHAVKATAANGAVGFHVEARYELARVLACRTRPADVARARALSTEAAADAQALGMTPFAAKARHLAAELDSRQSILLTPREREVAELLAQGLTNREIADRLYLSERTAQNHVQHILEKLGVHSKLEAAAQAVERGLVRTSS